MDLERTEFLDPSQAVFLHVTGNNAGKRTSQIRGELVRLAAVMQIQRGHRLVGRDERLLERQRNLQRPVEIERILLRDAMLAHLLDARSHALGDFRRIVDDDLVARGRGLAQGQTQELVDLLEIRRRRGRAGQDQRERQSRIFFAQQDAEQIEDFLRRADAAREHDDAVPHAHEGFQALFDVRHDHQVIHDRIRRLGGDDARLGDADVAHAAMALLGVGDRRALHRSLHRARAAAGADIEPTQTQLVADLLGVEIFVAVDRMAAPADHQIRIGRMQDARIAQQPEHRIGDAFGGRQIAAAATLAELDRGIGQIADHSEQQLGDAADDFAVDEGHRRCVDQVDAHAAILLQHLDIEIGIQLARRARVVGRTAAGQYRQRAAAQQFVHAADRRIAQTRDLVAGQHIEAATRIDVRVDGGEDGLGGIVHCTLVFVVVCRVDFIAGNWGMTAGEWRLRKRHRPGFPGRCLLAC